MGKPVIARFIENGVTVEKEIEVIIKGEKTLWEAAKDHLQTAANTVTVLNFFHKDTSKPGNKGSEITE